MKQFLQKFSSSLIGKTFWVYFFTFLIAPTGYLIKMIISRSTSVEELWIMYAMINLVIILSSYNDLWLTETFRYFLPKYLSHKNRDDAKTITVLTFAVQFGTAVLIGIGLYVLAPWLTGWYFGSSPELIETTITIVRYFSLYFLWVNLYQVLYSVFLSYQDTFSYKFVEFVRMWGSLMFIFVLYLYGFESIVWFAWWWIVGLAVSLIACLLIFWLYYNEFWIFGRINVHDGIIADIKSYALWAFIGINAGNLLFTIDKAMVIALLWPVESGLYEIYASLINIRNLMIAPVMGLVMSITSSYVAKKQRETLWRVKNTFFNALGWAGMTLWVMLSVLGPELAHVLFGAEYVQAWVWLMYSWWATIIPILLALVFQFLAWEGKMRERVKIVTVVTIANVILNYIFISRFGVMWAIVTTLIWWLVMFVSGYRMLIVSQPIQWQWSWLIKNLFLTLCAWSFLFFFKDRFFFVWLNEWLSLGMIVSLYYVFLIWCNYHTVKKMIADFKNRMK